jgi:IMP cyclohydrolase
MYVGRLVAVGRTPEGKAAAIYRVSSRSFPNRTAVRTERGVAIVPKPGFEGDVHKNPYIAYNCCRAAGSTIVVTNGSQTDPIAEKIAAGTPARDALVGSLIALDYEKDSYNTPRIAAVIEAGAEAGWLGVVRHDGLNCRRFQIEPGRCFYVATYEHNDCREIYTETLAAATAEHACRAIIEAGVFGKMTHAVTGVAAVEGANGQFELATYEVPTAG